MLNQLLGRTSKRQLPKTFKINNCDSSDPKLISDGFNNFFTNVGPQLADKIPRSNVNFKDYLNKARSPTNSLFLTPTDYDEIIEVCNSLKSDSSPGFDEIKPGIIKSVKHLIAVPLVHIFNLSVTRGIFPSQLKTAKVIPVFKSGDSDIFNNYRPISVLPIFSKVFERLVHNRLYNFISRFNLIHHRQFGFRSKYSTDLAIMEAYNEITNKLDKNMHTIGIFLDLSKAFDTINHDILLHKLHYYGVRGTAFEWFKSYLQDRIQFVSYNNCKSDINPIHCGVPQGSILGPLLFIIYMNDIVYSSTKMSFYMFADDTNLIISDSNLQRLITTINIELSHISSWFKANKLSLNIKKTNYIIFKNKHSNRKYENINISIDNNEIERVSNTKFLGVFVDECLTWSVHNNYVVNIVSKYTGILYRLKHCLPNDALFSLYTTLVLPYLNYCNIVWADGNNCNLNAILLKQKKIIRLCTGSHWLAHSLPLFKQVNALTIYDIHRMHKAIFMYKFINNNLPINFNDLFLKNEAFHNYGTRTFSNLRPCHFKTNLGMNTIPRQGPILWNGIPENIKNTPTLVQFKKGYKKYLVSSYN